MTRFPRRMFPDACDVFAAAAFGTDRDASGGRGDDPNTPSATAVACSYQPLTSQDLAAAQSVGDKTSSRVYFRQDPGDLRTGSRLVIRSRGGQTLTRPFGVSVLQVVREGITPAVTIWRADCQGRA